MALFESYERRIDKINEVLAGYGISSIEEAQQITKDAGLDVYNQIKGIQPICFESHGGNAEHMASYGSYFQLLRIQNQPWRYRIYLP